MKYEYKVVLIGDISETESKLNALAAEGWRVISATTGTYVLERAKA